MEVLLEKTIRILDKNTCEEMYWNKSIYVFHKFEHNMDIITCIVYYIQPFLPTVWVHVIILHICVHLSVHVYVVCRCACVCCMYVCMCVYVYACRCAEMCDMFCRVSQVVKEHQVYPVRLEILGRGWVWSPHLLDLKLETARSDH